MKDQKDFTWMRVVKAIPFRILAWVLLLASTLPSTLQEGGKPNTLTEAERLAGWRLLFDGESLHGWRAYGKQEAPSAGWRVENGLLIKLPGVRGGDIITREKYADFELDWEWWISSMGNNGVKYLVTEARPGAPGHEYQMIDDKTNPDALRGAKRMTAAFYDVLPASADKPTKGASQWNRSKIVIQGNRVEHWLNGQKVLVYELGSAGLKEAIQQSKFKQSLGFGEKIAGHIMLTDHQDEARFRNIKLRIIPSSIP